MDEPLIGRSNELEILAERTRRASRGPGGTVLIGGEAGVGKTRLLHDFALQLGGGRASVTSLGCDEFSVTVLPALQPLIDRSARRTQVLIVDDLQWADEAALRALATFARGIADERVVSILAYRDDDLTGDRPALRFIGRIAREPGTISIRLGPLGGAETRALVRSAAPSISVEAADEIAERSEGIPFAALALARAAGQTFPLALQATAAERMQALEPPERAILEAAAAIGGRFDAGLLSGVAQAPLEDVLVALRRARDARMIDECAGEQAEYAFHREVVREAIVQGLLAEQRRNLDERIDALLLSSDFGERAILAAQSRGRYDEAARMHERLLRAQTQPEARALRARAMAQALACAGNVRQASSAYARAFDELLESGMRGEAAKTFALWAPVAVLAGDVRGALSAGEKVGAPHIAASLRAYLGDVAGFRAMPRESELDDMDAAAAAYALGSARSSGSSAPANAFVRALDLLAGIRRGALVETAAALRSARDDVRAGGSAAALHAAAAMHVAYFCGDDAAVAGLDLQRAWSDAFESGNVVTIGALAAPYARRLFAMQDRDGAGAVLAAAFEHLAPAAVVLLAEALVVAAEFGDGAWLRRAGEIAGQTPDALIARGPIAAARAHVAAWEAQHRGDRGGAAEWARRARTEYRAMGWRLHEAAAEERAGNTDAALALLRSCGAQGEVRRIERALRVAGGDGVASGALTPREREIAALVAAGISNKSIGERLFVTAKSVEKHVTSIYRKLGLHRRAQLAAFIASAERPARRGNLPSPVTPFVGRTGELEELDRRLAKTRLITLTGPGGSGKTRLALESGRRSGRVFDGGVWFVDVTALPSSDAILPAIAGAIGVGLERGARRLHGGGNAPGRRSHAAGPR